MPRLKFEGPGQYSGLDSEMKRNIIAKPGDVFDLSEAKAAQLLKDYPNQWKKEGAAAEPKKSEAPVKTPEPVKAADLIPEPEEEAPAPKVKPVLKKPTPKPVKSSGKKR